jgi:hypothetical protein
LLAIPPHSAEIRRFLEFSVGVFPLMASFRGVSATKPGIPPSADVVEIGLLLPAQRANDLVELSKRRQQSVAQILRGLIDRALSDAAAIDG